ncbi:MAG: HDOD domain-containing protein [Nitrospirae bacterium]|nr:HDOD domain-containing protein [Nitrospirota bacterium]
MARRDIPTSKFHYLRLLQEIHQPDLDLDRIEQVIKQDVSLTYKLLLYVNSAFFGWRNEIRSIRHALALIGEKEVRKWTSLLALAGAGEDKPSELIASAIARAKFCEAMAPRVGLASRSQELFLTGMFSLLDAILDRPLRELVNGLPLAREIKDALLGEPNRFRGVLEAVIGYERGDWERFSYWTSNLNIPEEGIPELYRQALQWADQSVSVLSPPAAS